MILTFWLMLHVKVDKNKFFRLKSFILTKLGVVLENHIVELFKIQLTIMILIRSLEILFGIITPLLTILLNKYLKLFELDKVIFICINLFEHYLTLVTFVMLWLFLFLSLPFCFLFVILLVVLLTVFDHHFTELVKVQLAIMILIKRIEMLLVFIAALITFLLHVCFEIIIFYETISIRVNRSKNSLALYLIFLIRHQWSET